MSGKGILVTVGFAFVILSLSSCGIVPQIMPTDTPLPTATATNTVIPTNTLKPTYTLTNTAVPTETFTPIFTIDPDCQRIQGKNLSLAEDIIGNWKNGEQIVWTFCKSGKLIDHNIKNKSKTTNKYEIVGNVLMINNKAFGRKIEIKGDLLEISLAPGFMAEYIRIN